MSADNGGEIVPAPEAKETRSNPKFVPYIPPRIDYEFYQAEVPSMLGAAPPPEHRPREWFKSTRAIHRPAVLDSPDVHGQ